MAYTVPAPADLKLRYPAFTAVDDEVVDYWIEDSLRIVTEGWFEGDYAPAILAHAAYQMALNGLGSAGGAVGDLAAMGVTDFKSASMSVSFDASTLAAAAKGGYGANRYGNEFAVFLRRNRGGPMLVGVSC